MSRLSSPVGAESFPREFNFKNVFFFWFRLANTKNREAINGNTK